jgi:opacity protein-like surface antigen
MFKAKNMLIVLSALLFITIFLKAQQESSNTLAKISFQKAYDKIEVFIECSESTPYDSFSLMNPNRLVIDFFGINQVSSEPMIDINEMNILGIRSALNRPGVARVVFNFTEKIPLYSIEERDNGLLVLFWEEKTELDKMEPAKEEKMPIEEAEMIAKPAPKKDTESKPETKKDAKPTVKVSLTEAAKKKMAFGFSSGFSAFQDAAFKEAYGQGGVFFKGEYSFFFPGDVKNFDIWTGVTYFQKKGTMTITEEDIKIHMTTFSLALRYLRAYSRFTPFVGIGIDYIVYKETLPEDFMLTSVGGSDLGFHAQGGVYYDISPLLSLKVHIRYLMSKTTENDIEINLGGIEYGLGLIFRFNL